MIRRLRSAGLRIGLLAVAAAIGAAGTGCGDGDFVPPPPTSAPESAGDRARSQPVDPSKPTAEAYVTGSVVRSIEMVWAGGKEGDEDSAEMAAARSQAGLDRARLRLLPEEDPEPKLPSSAGDEAQKKPKSQAQLVREAVARKTQALIVDPEDPADAELALAVQAARDAKIPVVILGRPLTGVKKDAGGAPMVLVAPEPFTDSARKLVELARRNAQNAGFKPDAGAILLVPSAADSFAADRAAALREALETARVSPVDEIQTPRDIDAGAERLARILQSEPRIAMVFGVDFISTTTSNRLASKGENKRAYIQAGYTSDESTPRMASNGEFAGVAEYYPHRLTRKAVSVAAALAQGRSVKSPVLMPISVRESPAISGSPHLQAEQNKLRQTRKAEEEP